MSQIPNESYRLLFKLPFYLFLGAGVGLGVGLLLIDAFPELLPNLYWAIFVFCNGGWMLALEIWFLEYRHRQRRLEEVSQRKRKPHLRQVADPKPYQDRLANFLECSQEEFDHEEEEELTSSMPFWSRFSSWSNATPKSEGVIQSLLQRIRRTVRGEET